MPEERLKFFSPVDRLAYAAFFLIFIGAFLFVRPFGEFPLIDDWVHSLTIHSYLADGDFFYSPLLASFLHVPILYGIGLGKLFGFSFFLLRLSNLILGFFTVIIFYRFLRHLKNPPPASFLLSLLLWFNPIFFSLSHTFMSEIPALFFLVTALFLNDLAIIIMGLVRISLAISSGRNFLGPELESLMPVLLPAPKH